MSDMPTRRALPKWISRWLCLIGLHGPVEPVGLHRLHCLSCDKEYQD